VTLQALTFRRLAPTQVGQKKPAKREADESSIEHTDYEIKADMPLNMMQKDTIRASTAFNNNNFINHSNEAVHIHHTTELTPHLGPANATLQSNNTESEIGQS
jgi:hypothetical protein